MYVIRAPQAASHRLATVVTDVQAAVDADVPRDYATVEDAVTALVLKDVELITAAHDSCYHKVKASYAVFPSARASQAIAKCRKSHGSVRKTEKGTSLKRWEKEKWKDKRTGKPCGHAGGGTEYCRPSKHVSKKTPKMYKGKQLQSHITKKVTTGRG